MFRFSVFVAALFPALGWAEFDPSTAVPEGVVVVQPSSSPQAPAQPVEQERIIIDAKSGQRMSNGAGGFFDPRTGKFYPRVAGGYIDNETGRFIPAP